MGWAGREGRADNVGETFLVNENGHVSLPFLFFPLSLLGIHFLLPVARLPLFCSVANCSRHASSLSIFLLRPLYDRAIVSEAKVEEIRILCCQRVTPYISTLCAFKCAPVFLIVGPLHSLPSFPFCLWPLQFYVSAPPLPSLPSPLAFTCISLPLAGSELFLAVDFYLWAAIRKRRAWWTALRSQPHRSAASRARDGTDGTPPRGGPNGTSIVGRSGSISPPSILSPSVEMPENIPLRFRTFRHGVSRTSKRFPAGLLLRRIVLVKEVAKSRSGVKTSVTH